MVRCALRRRLRARSASRTRPCGRRGRTAGTSSAPPTATGSTTSCCRRATRSGSTPSRSPRRSHLCSEQVRLLVAVRMGELVAPQLARQLATLDHMLGGRLTINIISTRRARRDAGERSSVPAHARARCRSCARCSTATASTSTASSSTSTLDPPRIAAGVGAVSAACTSAASPTDAKQTAAEAGRRVPDVARHGGGGRRDGRRHVARAPGPPADRCATGCAPTSSSARPRPRPWPLPATSSSALDDEVGAEIRGRSLDTASAGVARQAELRESADGDGFAEPGLWTGIGRARSGAGAAIVGDPDQVAGQARRLPGASASTPSSSRATPTCPSASASPAWCSTTSPTRRCSDADDRSGLSRQRPTGSGPGPAPSGPWSSMRSPACGRARCRWQHRRRRRRARRSPPRRATGTPRPRAP